MWTQCSMIDAIEFASGKQVVPHPVTSMSPDTCCDVVQFSDGTAVACKSVWHLAMPEDPRWWFYKPA